MPKVELTNMVMILDKTANRVLVQERTKDPKGITFPGGHVEGGESFAESAIREVKEETGLDVKNLKSCGVIHWCNEETDERYLAFLYKTSDYSGKLIESTKEGRVFWANVDTLNNMELSNNFEECLPIFFVENYNEGFGLWNESHQKPMVYR